MRQQRHDRVLLAPEPTDPDAQPMLHFMTASGDAARPDAWGGASDWFGMAIHGHGITHLDAVGHIFWDQKLYNGKSARAISTAARARYGNIEVAGDGIVSRGVLLDIPAVKGRNALEPGYAITVADLEAAEAAAGLQVSEGDVLVVRTGRDALDPSSNGHTHGHEGEMRAAGLQAECLPWLYERRVSVLVGDATQDVKPSGYERVPVPIHIVGIRAMGLWLLDNAHVEHLASACASESRWSFLFAIAPLRLARSTGSPVNPLAVL